MYLIIAILMIILSIVKTNELLLIGAALFAVADSIDSLRRELKKKDDEEYYDEEDYEE